MFGGQFLAQGICAASRTIEDDKNIHSLHAYFLRPGDVDKPIEYSVEVIRDGRSFSHRHITAVQNDKECFCMYTSWAASLPSLDFSGTPCPEVPPPESVSYTYDDFCRDQRGNQSRQASSERPMDIRYINPPAAQDRSSITEDQRMWMKIRGTTRPQRAVHDAGLAYLSDSTLIDHIMLPHGRRWLDEDVFGTSLDHAMWFHTAAPCTDWLLFDQAIEWTGNGRGTASGRLYTQDRVLVATCFQEGLMRVDV